MTNGGLIGVRSGIPSSLVGRWSIDDYRQFQLAQPPVYTTISQIATPHVWLDPSNTSSITHSSNNVTQINDLSGNGRHATQANTTYSPITNSHTINSLNVLRFNGAKALTMPAPPTAGVLFIVLESVNATGLRYALGHNRTADNVPGPFYLSQTVRSSARVIDLNIFYSIYQFSALYASGVRLIVFSYGPNGMLCRINKQFIGSFTYSVPSYSNTMFIGARNATGAEGWDGNIGEVVYFSSQSIDILAIENLIAAKWGIT